MKRVIIIGGGIAGMQCALQLAHPERQILLLERDASLGGKVRGWHALFPTFTPAEEVLHPLMEAVAAHPMIEVRTECAVQRVDAHAVTLCSGEVLACDAVVVAAGFTLFDARIKEEYGYGLYDHVYTSADIEQMLREDRLHFDDGNTPQRIALLHCVGSRDEKVCQSHCSRVCCITGVKQAMELRRRFPTAEIFNFYMDIRMFGAGYEELYREAQLHANIHFIRGRISEAAPTFDGRIQIKAEDTLTGRPLRMGVDMLILLVGMQANRDLAQMGLPQAPSGFLAPLNPFAGSVNSPVEGVFYAGTITAPKTVGETLHEAVAAAEAVKKYLDKV